MESKTLVKKRLRTHFVMILLLNVGLIGMTALMPELKTIATALAVVFNSVMFVVLALEANPGYRAYRNSVDSLEQEK